MSDMDRDVEDGVEERRITLKNKAEALRRQISPLSANSGALQALWVGSGIAAGKQSRNSASAARRLAFVKGFEAHKFFP